MCAKKICSVLLVLICCAPISVLAAKKAPIKSPPIVPIVHWQTTEGVGVFFVRTPALPMLDVRVVFSAGSANDGKQAGVAQMTAGLLASGSKKLSADDIAEQLDRLGAIYSAGASRDMASVSLRTLTKPTTMARALSLFELVLKHPNFPMDQFKRRKNQVLQAIADRDQQPGSLASRAFFKQLYQSTPYAHAVMGEKATMTALSVADVNKFYQRYYRAGHQSIILVGDIDVAQAKAMAQRLVLVRKNQAITPVNQANQTTRSTQTKPTSTPRDRHIDFPTKQVTALIGQLGIDRHDKDYFALQLGNYVLGGGALVSRLFHDVRDERGLAYSVYSFFYPLRDKGPFLMGLQTRGDKAKEAISIAKKTLRDFLKQPVSQQEITRAKHAMGGRFLVNLASNAAIADAVAEIAFYQLPLDYLDQFTAKIQALSPKQVQAAFLRHINPKAMLTVTVGNFST